MVEAAVAGNEPFLLEMRDITKSFPGVQALRSVGLKVAKGSVHALIGENGAGKSTLMKVLIGMYRADAGEILFRGRKVAILDPGEALRLGISMIHQELNPIPGMTIAENLFVGREPTFPLLGVVNRSLMNRNTVQWFKEIGLDIDPTTKVAALNVAERQMLEIVKAISCNADLIIMDEPTSAITGREVEKLFGIIRTLTAKGKSVIYISHKIDELYQISDVITVLRDGQYIGTRPTAELDRQTLISMMVGREISNLFPKEDVALGPVVLEVQGLCQSDKVKDISFTLRQGEILGISGLMGAGRTEMVETLFGLRKASRGTIRIHGEAVKLGSPNAAIAHRLALVSEDRKLYGLNLKDSVKNNVTLVNLAQYCLGGIVRQGLEKSVCAAQIERFNIRTYSQAQIANTLSGGNQQKVVIAKWILTDPDIIILDEPTRGIDVAAKAEIHRIIVALAKEGKAILLISSELPEIMGMSDRVLVLHEGRLTGEFAREDLDQESIMMCATGQEQRSQVQ
jgi:inositol transport system ATP-binding protein